MAEEKTGGGKKVRGREKRYIIKRRKRRVRGGEKTGILTCHLSQKTREFRSR